MIHRRGFFQWLTGAVAGLFGIEQAESKTDSERWWSSVVRYTDGPVKNKKRSNHLKYSICLDGPPSDKNDFQAYVMSKVEVGKWQLICKDFHYLPLEIELI